MNGQKENEVIKAFAYGKTPDEIVNAEDITLQEVLEIQSRDASEIAKARAEFEDGGFIDGDDL
jgi:hypothetical protein